MDITTEELMESDFPYAKLKEGRVKAPPDNAQGHAFIDYEVRLRNSASVNSGVIQILEGFLESFRVFPKSIVPSEDAELVEENHVPAELWNIVRRNVGEIVICDESLANVKKRNAKLRKLHIYTLNKTEGEDESLENDEDNISACKTWMLPHVDFHGQWEALHYDHSIKADLLDYCQTAMYFAKMGVSQQLVNWNKVILLHGPPGTGKTSLAQALAHKMSIRYCPPYKNSVLLEINSHSLFSKYFSESGKLVQKMFDKIRDYCDDPAVFVCIVIDEVESLTAARSQSSDEPSDAVRVVNAVLTQLDLIKNYPNVLVLTTSNVTGRIDLAFVDRADMKVFIGPPGPTAVYSIIQGAADELHQKGLIVGDFKLRFNAFDLSTEKRSAVENDLMKLCHEYQGVSGRTCRKIPFLAHMRFIKKETFSTEVFVKGVQQALAQEKSDRRDMTLHKPSAKKTKYASGDSI